jgi:hypothetical protein
MDITPDTRIVVWAARDRNGGWNVATFHGGRQVKSSLHYVRASLPAVIAEHIRAAAFVTGTIRVQGRSRRRLSGGTTRPRKA